MKHLITTIFLFVVISMNAQIPTVVNDPQANASLTSRITQGAMQVKNGVAQLKILKDAKDALSKVNNILRDVNEIEEIYELQVKILNNSTNSVKKLRDSKLFSAKEITNINRSYTLIIDGSIKSLDALDKLLTNNLFTMEDADRLKFIKEIKGELQERYVGTQALYLRYINKAEERARQNFFKKNS